MINVIFYVGCFFLFFSIGRYVVLTMDFRGDQIVYKKYNLNKLAPSNELKFIIYLLTTNLIPLVIGILVIAISNMGHYYSEKSIKITSGILILATIVLELLFRYVIIKKYYNAIKGDIQNEEDNSSKM